MADEFTDFVEKVKAANPLSQVMEESGAEYRLAHKRGKFLRGETHNSLVVQADEGWYVWNSRGERGDVFNWLERRQHMDFMSALQYLADRAKIPMPKKMTHGTPETRAAARLTADVFGIAQRVMAGWLRASAAALDYVRGRGWTDETINHAGLGYTGGNQDELRGELRMYGIDLECPQAVAVLGYRGDVAAWGRKYGTDIQENWLGWGMIPGLVSKTRLVYPHIVGGRTVYMTARNILGAEINQEGREVKSWNMPVVLAGGQRQVFYNHEYGKRVEECVVVEGQADAVTLGQWGIAATALAGTGWQDHAELLGELRKRHKTIYLMMDNDAAGQRALVGDNQDWPLERVVGPMARVLLLGGGRGARGEGTGNGSGPKDANDWLKLFVQNGISEEEQRERVRTALDESRPMVITMADWAGRTQGAAQDDAYRRVFEAISRMDKLMAARHRDGLRRALGLEVREYNQMLSAARGEAVKETDEAAGEVVETLGGAIGGWLLEYLYDETNGEALLAWRDPQGRVDVGKVVEIDGVRYGAKTPNSMIRQKGVIFPSKLGALKSTRELVAIVESFIHKYYLLDDRFFGRMAAYYVLLTWLYDAFSAIPYLRATGDYGSGKSELMKRIGHICYRLMITGGAGSSASLFRALDEYKGTAFMDEMDLSDGGDMTGDLIKILNMGAMRGNPIWRLNETTKPDGTRDYEPTAYSIFGPKLIAMRKDFKDQAVTSRCLTIKLMGKDPLELKARGVKLHTDNEFFEQAAAIRNLLVRWRLAKWQPEIVLGEDLMDLEVPARLNQVTMPLKAIAMDDPELMKDIITFVRSLNDELVLERSMGLDARVMDALVAIREDPKYKGFLSEGIVDGYGDCYYTATKHITGVVNGIIDEMNVDEGDDDETKKKKSRGTTSHTVGRIVRHELQLPTRRRNLGYIVIYDDLKMDVLKIRYGLKRREA
jgi:hypothetical protein